MKRHLERSALGATLPNLNAGIVKTAPAPQVPAQVQATFAEAVAKVAQAAADVRRASAAHGELFASLQSRAFRGEL
jgi:type I restriction enzyme S subunit